MDLIIINSAACMANGIGQIAFDNIDLATAFLKTMAGTITPDAFVSFVTVNFPQWTEAARTLVTTCFGSPA